ncbi:DNA polymerase III subunit delta [Vagococcus salmoninarum]|uniref:DNA polymerase III subunit delta n=1 Tax=Vagococcus salmoninarum TaxID=2739 RepID=A0A429ZTK3_9ENTE|nr:DNA polymerase III subunit delta [Vagococcus salmoninarum]MBE9389682.1 DNA polymerase III subunit delta [Vagococcus salmoninarum]RST97057.1 DNA polymerase III subunit delta [Vagococcus salmoninarum]
MSLQTALKAINNGKLQPVYLVLGQEQFLSDIVKRDISRRVIQDEDDELNFATYDMNDTTLSLAVEEASTIPFFGDYRLVNIENPYFLTGEKRQGGLDHNIGELVAYLENPSESTILVFYCPYEKLDERKKVVKLLKKVSTLLDVKSMGEKEVRNYTQQYIQNEGYEITPEAFDLLVRLTDMDLSKIMGEMTKILLYASETKKIQKPMIENLVPKSLDHNIFDMVTYVMAGKADEALSLYRDLLLQGEETIKINAILISQFRLLLQVKIMLSSGYQQSNLVDVLKIHPYRVKLAMQQVRNFDLKQLKTTFLELVDNDYRIKTGQLDKELIFELFILKHGQLSRK